MLQYAIAIRSSMEWSDVASLVLRVFMLTWALMHKVSPAWCSTFLPTIASSHQDMDSPNMQELQTQEHDLIQWTHAYQSALNFRSKLLYADACCLLKGMLCVDQHTSVLRPSQLWKARSPLSACLIIFCSPLISGKCFALLNISIARISHHWLCGCAMLCLLGVFRVCGAQQPDTTSS